MPKDNHIRRKQFMREKIKAFFIKVRNYILNEKRIKKWLLQAVVLAEKELGSGTGKVKLSTVYDMFIVRFPIVSKLISFNTFSSFVDDVLVTMRELLESNKSLKEYIDYGV